MNAFNDYQKNILFYYAVPLHSSSCTNNRKNIQLHLDTGLRFFYGGF